MLSQHTISLVQPVYWIILGNLSQGLYAHTEHGQVLVPFRVILVFYVLGDSGFSKCIQLIAYYGQIIATYPDPQGYTVMSF